MDRFLACARRALPAWLCVAALSGCGAADEELGPESFALQFAAKVGDEPFSCSSTFDGVGTSQSSIQPLDFRMYIHHVRLVGADGSEQPLALDQDAEWQRDDVALLDFEDGTGTCPTGSPQTRTEIRGTAPAGDYVGVKFMLGLPPEMNHLDAATAPAPFNIPGLWWSWKGGYKFVRLELITTMNPTYFFHLGATGCDGSVKDGFSCEFANLADIHLDGDPGSSTFVFDIKSFYAGSDLDQQVDPEAGGVAGCMAFPGDPECPPVFNALGMTFGSDSPADTEQTTFRVE